MSTLVLPGMSGLYGTFARASSGFRGVITGGSVVFVVLLDESIPVFESVDATGDGFAVFVSWPSV